MEIADRYGGALLEALIVALIEAGKIKPLPVKPLSPMLTGALIDIIGGTCDIGRRTGLRRASE